LPFPLAALVLRGSGLRLVPDFRVFQFDVAANLLSFPLSGVMRGLMTSKENATHKETRASDESRGRGKDSMTEREERSPGERQRNDLILKVLYYNSKGLLFSENCEGVTK
jgi:hypothetical protein